MKAAELSFKHDDQRFSLSLRHDTEWRGVPKKMRAYIWGPGDGFSIAALQSLAKKLGAPHVYTRRGDFPELDKAWDQHNKRIVAAKESVLVSALEALRVDIAAYDIKFSRKAGCSCGCSPGFILEGPDSRGMEMFITRIKKEGK